MKNQSQTSQTILRQIHDLQTHMASVRDQRQDGLFAELAERFLTITDAPTFRGMGHPVHNAMVAELLDRIAGELCGRPHPLSGLFMVRIEEAGFLHGFSVADGWILSFFWFLASSEGLAIFSNKQGNNLLFRISMVGKSQKPGQGAGPAVPGEH